MKNGNFNLTTDGMQLSGKHFMGANKTSWTEDGDAEKVKSALARAEQEQIAYVDRLLEKDKDCKPYTNRSVIPVGNRVIIKPYEKNPYRVPLMESKSGLIIGDFDTAASYKSNETGEDEAAQRGIWCCEVISVGKECKYVEVGEDVYVNFMMAVPVPFGDKGYYSINETNIICSIRNDIR